MKIYIDNDKNNFQLKDQPQVQMLNTSSQWLKSLVPPHLMDRKFFVSLYEKLKDDSEFVELMHSTKKLSVKKMQDNENSSVVDSVCYNKLSKEHEDVKEKFNLLEQKLLEQVLKESVHSYKTEPHTHSGFAYYLYYSWANEMGICLRPDMLYYTVVCETVSYLTKHSQDYPQLLSRVDNIDICINCKDCTQTNSIKSTRCAESFGSDTLNNFLSVLIKDPQLKELMSETSFSDQPENFSEVLKFGWVKMASVHYNLLKSFCGIKSVEITCSEEDWKMLTHKLRKLSDIVPDLSQYYEKCISTVEKIAKSSNTDGQFFKEIFWLETPCESGHSHGVKGWFSNFYLSTCDSLEEYPAHANYVPYMDASNGKKYIKTSGMTYSTELDGVLYPKYGTIDYEVSHDGIFSVLTNSKSTELTSEETCKSMIKSINASMGYKPTEVEIEKAYNTNFKKKIDVIHELTESVKSVDSLATNTHNNPNVTMISKFMETVTYATINATTAAKENWGTALFLASCGIAASILFVKFSK